MVEAVNIIKCSGRLHGEDVSVTVYLEAGVATAFVEPASACYSDYLTEACNGTALVGGTFAPPAGTVDAVVAVLRSIFGWRTEVTVKGDYTPVEIPFEEGVIY